MKGYTYMQKLNPFQISIFHPEIVPQYLFLCDMLVV